MRPLPSYFLFAFTPPGCFGAHGFWLQYETFGLYNIKEQFADHVGITGIGHLEAGAESLITATVAHRIGTVIKHVPLGSHTRNIQFTVVMLPAAHIRPGRAS